MAYRWIAGAILLVSAALRLVMLNLVPFHHDEGVNGFFLTNLVRDGKYTYDPTNYHGPTIYYLALPFVKLFGLTAMAVRGETAWFGIGVVLLILCLHQALGRVAALSAAAMVALSPGMVYISRYFIHEMLFMFFTLGMVVAMVNRQRLGTAAAVVLTATSAAMLTATKETAGITIGVLLAAELCTYVVWRRYAREDELAGATLEEEGIDATQMGILGFGALATFLAINVVFYSSFFTNWHGVSDAFRALQVWTHTGTHEHVHPFYQYFVWIGPWELPILALGLFGCVLALVRFDNRYAVFNSFWSLGMLLAYSAISYKTPWLAVNFLLPLAISAGYTISVLVAEMGETYPTLVGGLAVLYLLAQCISLNFYHYDGVKKGNDWYQDTDYGYVYAHTTRELWGLLDAIDTIGKKSGLGHDAGIAILADEYWPLPWYLNDWPKVGYYGGASQPATPVEILIAKEQQEAAVDAAVGRNYVKVGRYILRPGLNIILYERADIPR